MSYNEFINLVCTTLCEKFPDRHRIVFRSDKPGIPLLTQFMVIPDILYLQHFYNGEHKDWFHHHRWGYMRSFVLSASYTEELWQEGYKTRKRFRTHTMNQDTVHRIERWDENCWTLFLMLDNKKDWGYFERNTGRYIPWEEFVQRKIPTIETGKLTKENK
jgi:hypothetical protein